MSWWDKSLCSNNPLNYHPKFNKAVRSCKFWLCTTTLNLETWPSVKVMIHPKILVNIIVWNIISRKNISVRSNGPDKDFGYVHCACDLDLWNMTLGKVSTHPWVRQQLCEILSRSNMAIGSCGLGSDFIYVCIVTLLIWPWVKVMTHPWVMDNNCVKHYQDPTMG